MTTVKGLARLDSHFEAREAIFIERRVFGKQNYFWQPKVAFASARVELHYSCESGGTCTLNSVAWGACRAGESVDGVAAPRRRFVVK